MHVLIHCYASITFNAIDRSLKFMYVLWYLSIHPRMYPWIYKFTTMRFDAIDRSFHIYLSINPSTYQLAMQTHRCNGTIDPFISLYSYYSFTKGVNLAVHFNLNVLFCRFMQAMNRSPFNRIDPLLAIDSFTYPLLCVPACSIQSIYRSMYVPVAMQCLAWCPFEIHISSLFYRSFHTSIN